jgi:4-amino-4-deoxy-L-arabinose transferase-like glycosyltransferase
MRNPPTSKPQPRAWLWALVLLAAALAPRAFALGNTVTPDEPNWVYRTLNFGAALARGDWAATAQTSHPGVTTMWLGSLGVAVARAVDPAGTAQAIDWLARIDHLAPENVEAFRRVGVLLDWARLPVVVANALGVVGVFWLARRLFGQSIALLAAFLLALDPFVAGLGGLLHVDGLLATFSILSVLALLNGLSSSAPGVRHSPFSIRRSALGWFALAGALAGLALLSKSPAIFLMPFAVLVAACALIARRISIRSALLGLFVFLILHFAFFIALYPAMWVDPASALGLLGEGVAYHATNPTRPTFFDGQAELNHSPAYYPVALAYRLSPIAMLGAIVAMVALLARLRRPAGDPSRFGGAMLVLFALAFVVFITPAAKKFDRYLLPAIPPLAVVAAWAIGQFAGRYKNWLTPATVLLQAILTLSVAPYPLMAYNPLLGSASGARDRIAVGWGEGFGAAAQWIAARDPEATVATGGLANFAPRYAGRTVAIDEAGLASADYFVFTLSEVQLAPAFFADLAQRGSLAHVIVQGGVEAAWVYASNGPVAQADWLRRESRPGDAILLDAPTPLAHALDAPVVLPRDATPESIARTLGRLLDRPRIVYVSTAAASPVAQRDVRAWLDANARLDREADVAGATIRVYTPERHAAITLDAFTVQLDGTLALIGLRPLSPSIAYPDRLLIAARWRVIAPPTADYSATLELSDADGNGWLRFGGPLRNPSGFAPVHWQPGEVVDQVFGAQVPPALAPGAYRLRFSVDRADGSRAGLVSASGTFSGAAPTLAAVQIDPARQPVDPGGLAVGRRSGHIWTGQAELIGIDLLSRSVATGDRLLSTLHWRALRDGLDPATEVRWLLAAESDPAAPPFEWRTPLAANARAPLRAGDVIAARYASRLPLELPDGRYRLRLAIGDDAVDVEAIEVTHRERAFGLPAGAAGIGSLGAFEVFLVESPPSQARPGDSIRAALVLRAGEEVSVNYTVFVHLLDPAGRIVAQVDTWPQAGAWPTANWVQGQVIQDVYTLTLPADAAAGDYRLVVGMYDSLDGMHLLAPDGSDRLRLRSPIRVNRP